MCVCVLVNRRPIISQSFAKTTNTTLSYKFSLKTDDITRSQTGWATKRSRGKALAVASRACRARENRRSSPRKRNTSSRQQILDASTTKRDARTSPPPPPLARARRVNYGEDIRTVLADTHTVEALGSHPNPSASPPLFPEDFQG